MQQSHMEGVPLAAALARREDGVSDAGGSPSCAGACRQPALTAGRFRWAVHVERWKPEGGDTGTEFRFLLSLIPERHERAAVMNYVFLADRKRALLSRLLSRRAAAEVLGLSSFATLDISRTKGQKPFLRSPRPSPKQRHLANWNFNISHEGDWVVLASEPICVCGVDVAAPADVRGDPNVNVLTDFADQLTRDEWLEIYRHKESADQTIPEGLRGYEAFQRRWSAKEAFVKARGDGLDFPLNRAGFHFEAMEGSAGASMGILTLDGSVEGRWSFFQHCLGGSHWVTVARGPTEDVLDAHGSFLETFARPTCTMSGPDLRRELHRESPPFVTLPVSFLVPGDAKAAYLAAGGHDEDSAVDVRVACLPFEGQDGACNGPDMAAVTERCTGGIAVFFAVLVVVAAMAIRR